MVTFSGSSGAIGRRAHYAIAGCKPHEIKGGSVNKSSLTIPFFSV
jgi:hypothetical protein